MRPFPRDLPSPFRWIRDPRRKSAWNTVPRASSRRLPPRPRIWSSLGEVSSILPHATLIILIVSPLWSGLIDPWTATLFRGSALGFLSICPIPMVICTASACLFRNPSPRLTTLWWDLLTRMFYGTSKPRIAIPRRRIVILMGIPRSGSMQPRCRSTTNAPSRVVSALARLMVRRQVPRICRACTRKIDVGL